LGNLTMFFLPFPFKPHSISVFLSRDDHPSLCVCDMNDISEP
jgi:hypothetical protein